MKRFNLFAVPVLIVIALISVVIINPDDNKAVENSVKDNTAEPLPRGRVLQYGIYKLVRGGKLVETPVTTTGKAISRPTIEQVEQTDRIPVKKDVYFSYQYRLSNFPASKPVVKLKRILIHPAITLPDGTIKTGSEYMIKGRVKRGEVFAFDGYAFNEHYEMVEGDWVFQIWYEDKKLIEQTFTSYMPTTSNG